MTLFYPRPEAEHVFEERAAVEGACPECGGEDVRRYRVLNYKGWSTVTKCQACLYQLAEEPLPIWGFWKPLTADWERTEAG